VIGRALFLASLVRGLSAYPRAGFWACLWVFYLLVAEYSWTLALGVWKPILLACLGEALVAYLVFRVMVFFQDDWPYWGAFLVGGFVLIALLP
jgi:hypothetical protein